MITAAVAMVAIASQAAVMFNWKTTKSLYDGMGDDADYATGVPVYLFASGTTGSGTTISREALLTALEAKTYASVEDAWKAVGYGPAGMETDEDAKVSLAATDSTVTRGSAAGDVMSFFFVAQNAKGDLFFSGSKDNVAVLDTGTTTPQFTTSGQVTTPSYDYITIDEAKGGAAGWVKMSSPGPIPEPTSGLLLLLGVAGLALRRKHV